MKIIECLELTKNALNVLICVKGMQDKLSCFLILKKE